MARELGGPKLTDRIADYEIVHELARSASGRILIGQEPGSNQLLAIKEMLIEPDAGLSPEEQIARFKRESDIHLELDHPNIVKAYAAGEDRGRHYLVMEFQPGKTWQAVMAEKRPTPIPQVLEWGIQLCHALAHLYQVGIVHRDIKPANCLISPAGQLKLADFGMARRAFAPGITQSRGMLLGTLHYMPPEQLINSASVDHRADVFAVGVILFKAFTGQLPFQSETPTGVAQRLLYDEPTDPLTLNQRLPATLAQKLLRCLAKDPDFRYPIAEAFARDLEEELHRADIYLAQGHEHAEHDEWRDANHCYQQAVAMDATDARSWFHLGESLQRLEQDEQASECFLKVIQLDSSHVAAYRKLGGSYQKRGNLEAAIRMYQRAWVLDPQDRGTCMQLAVALQATQQLPEALEQLTFVVEKHPEWAEAHFQRGRIQYALRRLDDALASFRTARRLSPGDPDTLFNLASLLHELGHLPEAEEFYEQLIVMTPERSYTHAHHNLACLWSTQGRYEEAEAQLLAVIAQERWGPSYMLLGDIYERSGRGREAIDAYRTALTLMPDEADVPIALAGALQRSFQPNAAIEALKEASRREGPDQARLLYHLALAYRTRGDTANATQSLQACLALKPPADLAKLAEELLGLIRPTKVKGR